MTTSSLDNEFETIINQIKPLYMSLNNSTEKNIVGNLIRELIHLSKTEFQKGQRNELAKALLFKLKSNQVPTPSTPKAENTETEAKSTSNQNLSRQKKRLSDKKHSTRHMVKNIRKIRFRSRSVTRRSGPAKQQIKESSKSNNHRLCKMTSHPNPSLSSSGSTVTDFDENFIEKGHFSSTLDTESDCATLSNQESGNESNNSHQHSSLQKLIGLLYEELPNQTNKQNLSDSNECKSKSANMRKTYQKCQQNSNSKTFMVSKPVISRAQISEADFYDQLVEVRRENEIEIAKLMNRKNAELLAVQQEAAKRHAELKLSIDKLEEQLAVAVANADKVRRQSEEQTNKLQDSMTKQLDNLYEQSAREKEELINEYQQKISKQTEAHQNDLERLTEQEELNKKLQKSVEEERLHCEELESKLQGIKVELHNAHEHQTFLQETIQHMERQMKNCQMNLEEQSDARYRKALAQHQEETLHLKAEHEEQLNRIKQDHEDIVAVLKSTIQCIQDELGNKVENVNKHNAEMLLTEISTAYERGRNHGEKECELQIESLQTKLKEVGEKYKLLKDNVHLRLDKIKEEMEKIKATFNAKQVQLQAEEMRIKQKLEKIEAVTNSVCNNDETQTDQTECSCVALRVSEVVSKEMAYWQGKSLEEAVSNAKKEEQLRLEMLFTEKEEHLNRQHKQELDKIKTEHTNRLIEWRRRAEMAQSKIKQFETELGETKRLLAKEVETRRQQLGEISQAREFERKEWERQHDEQMQRMQLDQEEKLRQMRTQFVEELQTATNRKLFEIENEYKSQLVQMSEKLHESQMQMDRLKQKLQQTVSAHEQMKQNTETAHQIQLEELRAMHEQVILSIKSSASKDRSRARTAEALLRQQEKLWNSQMKQWTASSTEKLLPADVQGHLESTIESLRLQVNILQKRIALLEGEQEPFDSSWEPSRYKCLSTKAEIQLPEKLMEHSIDRPDHQSVRPDHATSNKIFHNDCFDQNHKKVTGDVTNQLSSSQQTDVDPPCSEKSQKKGHKQSVISSEDIQQTALRIATMEMEA